MTESVEGNSLKSGYHLHWYRIISVLGQGGFGITYLAHDENLDQRVAIKEYLCPEVSLRRQDATIHPLTASHEEQYRWGLERFISEARTLAQFDHANIVRVFSVFEENNTAYMVMRYEEGRSLQALIEHSDIIDEATLTAIALPLMDGLNVVHKSGFIHRDIKPANIYIREDGSPVLLDFGSARLAIAEKTHTLTAMVSPGYAPFEQYYSDGDPQGPWTDIYSFGATLYRAVCGQAPMTAIDRSKTLLKGLGDFLVPASEIAKDKYSPTFLKAIDHAMAFDEHDRPQGIEQWQQDFSGVTVDEQTVRTIPVDEIDERIDSEAVTQRLEEETVSEQTPQEFGVFKLALVAVATALVLVFGLIFLFDRTEEAIFPETPVSALQSDARRVGDVEAVEPEPILSEVDTHIADLLDAADTDRQENRLTRPENDNAYEKYRQVLSEEPGNQQALTGLRKIADRYASMARNLIDKGDFAQADDYLRRGENVEPSANSIRTVREYLDQQKTLLKKPQKLLQFSDAMEAYRNKNYADAFVQFKKLAKAGHADAQHRLGMMYVLGQGTDNDYALAADLFRASSKQKHPAATFNLGMLYERGKGVKKDIKKARRYYRQAAKAGLKQAASRLKKLKK